jgi:hypothetical protein
MLYPIWKALLRPLSNEPRLERLLKSYNPAVASLKLRLRRCDAFYLREGLFGPEGLRNVPDRGSGGVMEFDLPNGWTLRLTYYAKGEFDSDGRRVKAGDVDAEFIPPFMREWPRVPSQDREDAVDHACPAG